MSFAGKMAPPRRPDEVLGTLSAALQAEWGIGAVPVAVGIHDSNASLLPHLRRRAAPFAVVSGAAGANLAGTVAIILGAANLLADGFSMAVSNYEAVKALHEFRETARATEEEHIARVPDGEDERDQPSPHRNQGAPRA